MHYKTIELIAKAQYLSDEYMCMLYTYVLKSRGQAAIVSKMQAGSHLSSHTHHTPNLISLMHCCPTKNLPPPG